MIKERDGLLYSTHQFSNYKFRAKFVGEDIRGNQLVNTDIYTTNTDRAQVESILKTNFMRKQNPTNINQERTGVIHWVSKEQDDATTKFLNDISF